MKIKVILFTVLSVTGCTCNTSIENTHSINKVASFVSDERTEQYSSIYKEAQAFFEKHPDYKQDTAKETTLYTEFNKLLKQEKYRNFSLSRLLEIAYNNIQH